MTNKTLDKLILAAKIEDWDAVNETIPNICNDSIFIGWALSSGLDDSDPNLRDLAASIIEKSKIILASEDINKLKHVMAEDKNIYAQYRSAFALFTHGIKDSTVIAKIKEALKDKDVSSIAHEYLDTLNNN